VYKFIEQEKANTLAGTGHSVKLIPLRAQVCRVLEVSRSGYYGWCQRAPSQREKVDAELSKTIKTIHEKSRGTYTLTGTGDAPRIHAELKDDHRIHCSCKRVARLMRQAGLVGVHRRKYRGTTRRDPKRDPYPDLVERQFTPEAPNKYPCGHRLWVADATQHETDEGWLYLAVVIDAYSRFVVGWATTEGSPCGMDEHFTAELVLGALEMALWNRRPEEGLIHHSDHVPLQE
jgi:putative transposase